MRTMRTNIESPAPKQWEPKLFKGGISCWFVSLFNHFVTHNIHVCLVLTHVAKPSIESGRSSMDQIVTPISTSAQECIFVIVYLCISVQVKERQGIKLTPCFHQDAHPFRPSVSQTFVSWKRPHCFTYINSAMAVLYHRRGHAALYHILNLETTNFTSHIKVRRMPHLYIL